MHFLSQFWNIEFRGIGKRYGTGEAAFTALHSIDLTIQEGEFVAIMGRRVRANPQP